MSNHLIAYETDNAVMDRIILIHSEAPPKPAEGKPCNGCGVCCATAPCPLGVIASRRFSGACTALTWVPAKATYRCGLIEQPEAHIWPALRPFRGALAPWLARFARRYISAGSGCDSDLIDTRVA